MGKNKQGCYCVCLWGGKEDQAHNTNYMNSEVSMIDPSTLLTGNDKPYSTRIYTAVDDNRKPTRSDHHWYEPSHFQPSPSRVIDDEQEGDKYDKLNRRPTKHDEKKKAKHSTQDIDDKNIYDIPAPLFKKKNQSKAMKRNQYSRDPLTRTVENNSDQNDETNSSNAKEERIEPSPIQSASPKRYIDDDNIYDVPKSIFKKLTLRRNKPDRKDDNSTNSRVIERKRKGEHTKNKCTKTDDVKTNDTVVSGRRQVEYETMYDGSFFKRLTLGRKKTNQKDRMSKVTSDDDTRENSQNTKTGVSNKHQREIDDENIYDVPTSIFKKLTLRRQKHKKDEREKSHNSKTDISNEQQRQNDGRKESHNSKTGMSNEHQRQNDDGEESHNYTTGMSNEHQRQNDDSEESHNSRTGISNEHQRQNDDSEESHNSKTGMSNEHQRQNDDSEESHNSKTGMSNEHQRQNDDKKESHNSTTGISNEHQRQNDDSEESRNSKTGMSNEHQRQNDDSEESHNSRTGVSNKYQRKKYYENIYDVQSSIFKKLTLRRQKRESKITTDAADVTKTGQDLKHSTESINVHIESCEHNVEQERYNKNEDKQNVKRKSWFKKQKQIEAESLYDVPSSIFKKLTLRRQKREEKCKIKLHRW
ncbi:uncharacterized protein [Antedon mediterranea]|uniref:uncharacterized protein isoform X2 n=1 Tax=Antedon mediterranea TaxID=105859 RepID=UPI003AF6857A